MKKLVLLCVLCGVVLLGCGKEDKQQDATSFPIEQQFIIASAGHYVPAEDPSVARAKELIDRASATYGLAKDQVADQAYTAYKIAREDGISVTAMEVLEAATLVHVKDSGGTFASSCAMYITIRKSGTAHAEAMMGLKGLITTVKDMGDAAGR